MAEVYAQLWETRDHKVVVVSLHINTTARSVYAGPKQYNAVYTSQRPPLVPLVPFSGSVRYRGPDSCPVRVATGPLRVEEDAREALLRNGCTAMTLAGFAHLATHCWPLALRPYQVTKHGDECLSGVEAQS